MFDKLKKLEENNVMALFVFVPIIIFFSIVELAQNEMFLKSNFASLFSVFNGPIYTFNLEVFILVLGLFYLLGIVIIRRDIVKIRKENEEARKIAIEALEAIAKTIDVKDLAIKGHSQRVAHYAVEICKRQGFDEIMQESTYYAGLLHDLGKIGIPDSILNKSGKLTAEEREKIESHTLIGYNILKDFNLIERIAQGVLCHHERLNGLGYPNGLRNKEIPVVAKIIAVADVYDALTSKRSYKNSLAKAEVIKILENGKGTEYDPEIVDIMIDVANNGLKEVTADLEGHDFKFKNAL